MRCGKVAKTKMPRKCIGPFFDRKMLDNGESVEWEVMTWSEG